MTEKNEFLAVMGAKVVRVEDGEIHFGNGYVIDFHPSETYITHVAEEANECHNDVS